MQIKVKYQNKDVPRLEKVSKGDWIDLYTAEDVRIRAGEYKEISLGVSMQLPEGYEAHVVPRSSIFKNYNVICPNSFGIIDNSYCGDNDVWKMLVYMPYGQIMQGGYEVKARTIPKGSRLCQFRIFENQRTFGMVEVAYLGTENRGGIGSTGK